ncbi:MAG: T9SS type A sorting domain-containing protein [Bacteroidota bacterium]
MRYINIIFVFALCFLIEATTYAQPTFYLRFETVTANGVDYEVDIYMAGSAEFELGSSNLQFTYDNTDMDNPTLVATEATDLTSSPFYSVTATRPMTNKASLNINLFSSLLSPLVTVPAHPTWIKLARLHFDVLDASAATNLEWSYNGLTTETVAFLADETTQIYVANPGGDLENLVGDLLPVELTSFEATAKEDFIQIDWRSATEVNFSGYEIQRSLDGIDFKTIAWVSGNGTTGQINEYRYKDHDIFYNQNTYYRLKQVDLDGSFEYSDVRVAVIRKDGIQLTSISPNPTEGQTKLQIESSFDSPAVIEIYSNTGQLVHSRKEDVQKGYNSFDLDLSQLPGGMYMVIVQQGKERYTNKLLKL